MKRMNNKEIIDLIPSKYTDNEKEEIALLLIDLANIYLETENNIYK
jgi:hypothetical protein